MPPVSTTRRRAARPLDLAVEAVAGDAGLVADNGAPRTDQPVEQRGLADVRTADDGQRACRRGWLLPDWAASAGLRSWMSTVVTQYSFSRRWPRTSYYRDTFLTPCLPPHNPLPLAARLPSLYQFFGPGGLLARTHPAYEFRRGQLQMAEAVEQALQERRHLIVEAGTGTGKTLAYLLPVIRSGKRVIISTGTKTLQEQLFFKDVPFLAGAPGRAARLLHEGPRQLSVPQEALRPRPTSRC